MTKIILLLIISTAGIRTLGQSGSAEGSRFDLMELFDATGKRFVNPPSDIAGSPYLQQEWLKAILITDKGKRFENIRIRLDLEKQEIHFTAREGYEAVAPQGLIKAFRSEERRVGKE